MEFKTCYDIQVKVNTQHVHGGIFVPNIVVKERVNMLLLNNCTKNL